MPFVVHIRFHGACVLYECADEIADNQWRNKNHSCEFESNFISLTWSPQTAWHMSAAFLFHCQISFVMSICTLHIRRFTSIIANCTWNLRPLLMGVFFVVPHFSPPTSIYYRLKHSILSHWIMQKSLSRCWVLPHNFINHFVSIDIAEFCELQQVNFFS